MQEHNCKMRDAIITAEAVEEYVSRGRAHRRITSVVEKLRELDSIYVKLQAEKRTLAELWLLFDACADKYPIMADYLSPSAEIFHSPLFESAIVKVQNELPLAARSGRHRSASISTASWPHKEDRLRRIRSAGRQETASCRPRRHGV
ncbi:hypothetical protein PC116_g21606 [Phytophthora cactorum]|nr:hypothetical protein PC120_g20738 [Phytophthora cactorum]KAG4230089.1 hypothetical protein PC116_g21606 [Phytophthora cactorum]